MHLSRGLPALLALPFAASHAISLSPRGVTTTLNGNPADLVNACIDARLSAESYAVANNMTTVIFAKIPPSLATRCLMSIPVDTTADEAMIDYLLPWVEFESTLGYLKSPPKGRLIPGVDIKAGLQEIKKSITNGTYVNQYQFVVDVLNVFHASGEGHLGFNLALSSAFYFERGFQVVSISSDGISLPLIYDHDDLAESKASGAYVASNIVNIDGMPIADFLTGVSFTAGTQDPDSQYNGLFNSPPLLVTRNQDPTISSFRAGAHSMPDSHNVRFANGSSHVYTNIAYVLQDLLSVSTGPGLHKLVETGMQELNTEAKRLKERERLLSKRASSSATTIPASYPQNPIAVHGDGYMWGYALPSGTCVLVVPGFDNLTAIGDANYNDATRYLEQTRKTARTLFAACKAAGANNLVIDVSANGGGSVFAGHELYRNLFPKSQNWSGGAYRASVVMKAFGFVATALGRAAEFFGSTLLASDSTVFSTWDAQFGPKVYPQDNLTRIAKYDFSNPTTTTLDPAHPFTITGYDTSEVVPEQPFPAENIVVVTDGICASTCTIFTGLMAREAGVRTIAMGGRPLELPMQAIGGTKGSRVMKLKDVRNAVLSAPENVTEAVLELVGPNVVLPSLGRQPLQPADMGSASVNWRNAFAGAGVAATAAVEGTTAPLQFVYEAANCRRFYKWEYMSDISKMWTDVADVAFRGGKCVKGSSTGPDGTIGASVLPYTDSVLSAATYTGPGMVNNGVSGGQDPAGKSAAPRTVGSRNLFAMVAAGVVAVGFSLL